MTEEALSLMRQGGELAITYGFRVAGALLLLCFGWIIAGWAERTVRRLGARTRHLDDTLKPLLASLVRYAILVFVLIAVLAQFGVQTTSIIAVLGAACLAIGLALQGTLANIAAGVMLLVLRPLKVGESIDVDVIAGTVEEIGLFTTILTTADGIFVSVPNGQLWNRTIRNYARLATRRVDVPVLIPHGDDIDRVLAVLSEAATSESRVLANSPPQALVSGIGDPGVTVLLRCWGRADDHDDLLFALTRSVKQHLAAAGLGRK